MRRREHGQALVEFALVLPVFFILVFGIVDFGLGLKAWITITNAAREGARYGAVTCGVSGASAANVKTKAVDAGNELIATTDVTVTNCPGDSTESVVVLVNYTYDMITPVGNMMTFLSLGALPASISMTSSADMRIE